VSEEFSLRPYAARDEDAAIALWLRSWETAYPALDFAARLSWWRARWRDELVPVARIVIAESATGPSGNSMIGEASMIGFVTVDPNTRYLDQLVVAPEVWRSGIGSALVGEAKRIAPNGLDLDVNTDNARAIGFYQKSGFVVSGAGKNQISGKPVHRMSWRPQAPCA
jgi:putative acetyltransferase